MEKVRNLALPGMPRYQPKELIPMFGYDNLYRGVAQVEIANLDVLGEIGFISAGTIAYLDDEARKRLLDITTTEVDDRERSKTKHDIRAWVQLGQERLHPVLAKRLHEGMTSYDPLDTARAMGYISAHQEAIRPAACEVGLMLADLTYQFAEELQLGRTHLQAALPITVGFWLATILSRYLYCLQEIDRTWQQIVGKISGAVGAYNAQVGLGITRLCGTKSFETRVLEKLGLKPARISTQILPPEPLANFLFQNAMLAASLAQFGQDARNLMRTEIAEFAEVKGVGEIGSSTMSQKTNPINFENTVGMWTLIRNHFGNVLDTLNSDLQRDLCGSPVMRSLPTILVYLMTQLNTMRRKDDKGVPFLRRVIVNHDACQRNFRAVESVLLAEPLQLALQIANYRQDGYKLVSETLVPEARRTGRLLIDLLEDMDDPDIQAALGAMPTDVIELLHRPSDYTGLAAEKAREIATIAREQLAA